MAPILATAAGVTLPRLDGPLQSLLDALRGSLLRGGSTDGTGGDGDGAADDGGGYETAYDEEELLTVLQDHRDVFFEEQVDLHQWIGPLNGMDATVRKCLERHPQLLLLPPVKRRANLLLQHEEHPRITNEEQPREVVATCAADAESVPRRTVELLVSIFRFWEALLRNATCKSLFGSVEECVDLLGAADDGLADAALAVLHSLSLPPALHRQQAPDVHQHHSTGLHTCVASHARLVVLARGYGTRATGLGLLQLVTADGPRLRVPGGGPSSPQQKQQHQQHDDPLHGPRLPSEAGQVHFCYYPKKVKQQQNNTATAAAATAAAEGDTAKTSNGDAAMELQDGGEGEEEEEEESTPVEISLTERDILLPRVLEEEGSKQAATASPPREQEADEEEEDSSTGSNKRRRLGSQQQQEQEEAQQSQQPRRTRTTAELFFLALSRSNGRETISSDALFSLLADIRWAVAYWTSQAGRVRAVDRRLRALTCLLLAHPSPDVLTGYFTAQPELCVELVDLLRPTVSSAAVTASCFYNSGTNNAAASSGSAAAASGSAAAAAVSEPSSSAPAPLRQQQQHDGIAGLAQSECGIPYETRLLALEALTALVSRRDGPGAGGSLSGSARLSQVLQELGVGKGQYLGLLPTLIRYALASLGSVAFNTALEPQEGDDTGESELQQPLVDGLASAEASRAPFLPPRIVQVQRALDMIDAVLTLTSAVVATPSGTSALTDCGLIPALLTTVAMDTDLALDRLLAESKATVSPSDWRQAQAVLRFVTAQAIQILESAVVTHSNALTAFHDLDGVDVLTSRLSRELASTGSEDENENAMEIDDSRTEDEGSSRRIPPSQRILLYSVVTCLTVVFHQESTSSSATTTTTTSTGAVQLRKKELTDAIVTILDDVHSFGGHVASLVATLLSDVMNSDPHIVHYVHTSGIATSFLNMVQGKKDADGKYRPIIPPVPELVMAIPNVLAALSLTEDGAKVVKELNPFPSLLRIFYHPDYAMPNSRCLLNEMTAIVGTGLDEITRHVERLNTQVLVAVANAVAAVADMAEDLQRREDDVFNGPCDSRPPDPARVEIETERTCLIQYVLNIGQLLEQILHNEDHCDPFVDAGGLDALLRLFPASMSSGFQFLTNVSSLSAPSVSTLHHATIEESLYLAFKRIQYRYNPAKLLQKITEATRKQLDALDESHTKLFGSDHRLPFSLDQLPQQPMHKLSDDSNFSPDRSKDLAAYLRNVAMVHWITTVLATSIKAICQRSLETGTGGSSSEREWKKALSNDSFTALTERLSQFYQSSLFEVCRLRTKQEFELGERDRLLTRSRRLRYRLRIVCPEGAVVRDGIEIDSCANVGSMEMGEIVESFDRCINSSGILRYRTRRGWVSEVTRGHGREPIAEVISLSESDDEIVDTRADGSTKRIEAAIPDLRMAAVGVLARGQIAYSELFGALSKLSVQSLRSIPVRSSSLSESNGIENVAGTLKMLSSNLEAALNFPEVITATSLEDSSNTQTESISREGAAMYYGCLLSLLTACLFDDKRERRMVNIPLLVSLVSSDPLVDSLFCERDGTSMDDVGDASRTMGLFGAASFVFNESIADFSRRAGTMMEVGDSKAPRQSVSRSVAASLPPLISLLRRLVGTPHSTSPVASIMSRVKWKDVPLLLGRKGLAIAFADTSSSDSFFEPERFVSGLQVAVSLVIKKAWLRPDFVKAPPHLVHPMISLIGDVIVGLEAASKKKTSGSGSSRSSSSGFNLSEYFRQRRRMMDGSENAEEEEEEEAADFEPDEAAITLMADMGFDRDRALDAIESTRSNQVEIAMEYALTHDPPSPTTIARRREEREARQQRLQAQQQQSGSSNVREGESAEAESTADSNRAQPAVGAEQPGADGTTAAPETEKKEDDTDIFKAKAELASWIEDGPAVSCQVLASMDSVLPKTADGSASVDGNGDAEALTVVLCSFMLDLCHRYPETRLKIVSRILQQLKAKITSPDANVLELENSIPKESEYSVAALCHAAVLFVRALPKTRVLILQQDLVGGLVSGIHTALKPTGQPGASPHPPWLASSLLLLDVMAQPIVAFSEQEDVKEVDGNATDATMTGEYAEVKAEHESQARELSEIGRKILSALSDGSVGDRKAPATTTTENAMDSESKSTELKKDDSTEMTENAMDSESKSAELKKEDTTETTDPQKEDSKAAPAPIDSIPAYFPLLPSRYGDACLDVCLKLLGCPDNSEANTSTKPPPPGVAHATLLLLLRLLRTPRTSSKCRRLGVAEAILGLPGTSRFTGNTGIVALIYRRLLEDETTLQTAMETEIRGTVAKLHAKKGSSSSDKPSVPLHSFMEAVTPLLCRDPVSFLKAMSISVKVNPKTKESPDPTVSLQSIEERAKHAAALADLLKKPTSDGNAPKVDSRPSKSTPAPRARGKSPHRNSRRGSIGKKNKKEKHSARRDASLSAPAETPATHITSLLMNAIMTSASSGLSGPSLDSQETKVFLWVGNLLEILTDLVLAVPACACAVHNYRPRRSKDKAARTAWNSQLRHALSGCPNPPKTFVAFLLHTLLPQDRWTIRNDHQIWDRRKGGDNEDAKLVKQKRSKAYRITKASQAAARVVLALVARPGEGRKRVIADLTFALSGGRLGGHGSPAAAPEGSDVSPPKFSVRELHALYSWGELCLGVAAPRSTGRNVDGMSVLHMENIKLMLDHGMVHALLYAVHRVKLYHPMASSTCSSLLAPLECLTRATVADAVKQLIEKEKNAKASQGGEAAAATNTSTSTVSNVVDVEETILLDAEEQEMEEDGTDSGGMDVDGDENDEQSDDEELSSGDNSEDSSSEDESEDTEMDDAESEEDEGSSLDESEDDPSEEVEEEGDWNVDYHNDYLPENQAELPNIEEFMEEDDGTERVDPGGLDEGWTRIESSAFGGMMMGGRGNALMGGGPERGGNRARGFIDAAEAMIGSLLRNGEISNETLAELEGSLGIRIMNPRAVPNGGLLPEGGGAAAAEAFAVRVLGGGGGAGGGAVTAVAAQLDQGRRSEVMGTLPHVNQRSQPDVGYSAFGSGGRWTDISSMEYVYGGPSVTGGSRNYDLVSDGEEGSEADTQPHVTQLDLQLFPGGPASASAARTQHSLHPLLCGVDLPPVNALVSDLLSHGVRATRFGQITTRRPGDWTNAAVSSGGYLVSTSNGNIIRSNRSHPGAPLGGGLPARHIVGPVGWTDDGLPVDATVEEFSSAFERAIAAETTATLEQSSSSVREGQNNETEAPASTASNETQGVENASPADAPQDDAAAQAATASGDVSMDTVENQAEGTGGEDSPPSDSQARGPDDHQQDNSPTDGDRVASSLAEGLRLSPGSEPGDAMSATNPVGEDAEGSEPASAPAVPPVPEAAAIPPPAANEQSQDDSNVEQAEQADQAVAQAGSSDSTPGEREGEAQPADTADGRAEPNSNGLVCPPDVDLEVFNSLPLEMQQDCVNQYNATQELAVQLDGSTLDPEVLAALPEDMRLEVIEQDRRERRMREQAAESQADPSHAEEMDNASFLASLSPELREEILLTADEAFLSSLPPNIVAEAQIIRERLSTQQAFQQHRRDYEELAGAPEDGRDLARAAARGNAPGSSGVSSKRKARSGKIKVECDRESITYLPTTLSAPLGKSDLVALIRLLYLLSPVRPPRLLQKLFQNLFGNPDLRLVTSTAFVQLLHENGEAARTAVESLTKYYSDSDTWRRTMDELFSSADFPPSELLGTAPDIPDSDIFNLSVSASLLRHKQGISTAAAIAANLPTRGRSSRNDATLPPVVAARLVDTLLQLCKSSPRFCLHALVCPVYEQGAADEVPPPTCFELLLDLLAKPMYARSSANLDQLLSLLESAVSPLSYIPKSGDDDIELTQREINSAAASGKEWADAPRITVSQSRLQLLCSILRMETCRDSSFTKVNTIVRRLCRVETNRGYVLAELASVAHGLGADAMRDLKALKIRMESAASQHQLIVAKKGPSDSQEEADSKAASLGASGHISSSVTLSTSSSELKLLRVLQTLQSLCGENWDESGSKKNDASVIVTEELVRLLRQLEFNDLWDELSSCLAVVQVLEGVKALEDEEKDTNEAEEAEAIEDAVGGEENGGKPKKLRNSAAGLLSRFLPAIEAFFVANASATRPKDTSKESEPLPGKLEDIPLENLVGGKRLMEFVATNKVILNALVRNNPSLLDKGLRALVQVPPCRGFLDFDVKRQWFKTQVRRLRQQASRRHGSLRLHIRRKFVFEDAYHQLRLRNADEMRGRLHITFRNEEGVDAGGLSREFFGILAKEIFNPNYALFTSTEDGCTFQPNPNSSINPDHLSYFRFVGRIVGKAVADGYLLDAHFTRSLYKHMLSMKPTHHDMEAIDPDYYRNLKTILEFNLADIGLELTFSFEDHSFGRSQTIDLIPNGRKEHVTEENKEEYVRLVCQHRMTAAIQSQIKAYLDGFYELVSPELIAIFTPRELELLISGLPDIDVHDLKKNTECVGWKATDKEIEWFWNIMLSLSRSEKASFLQFVTGSSKVPLAGFSELQGMRGIQKFSIHKTSGGKNGALMSAHTCFNSLDLPAYASEEEMREKLLYAINEGGGAFLFA